MDKPYLTRGLMSFEDLESFIDSQNEKLKASKRYLCASALDAYNLMMVGVERSLGHKKPLVSAHAKFRIAQTESDCVFPSSTDIDWRYAGAIIGVGVIGILNLAWSCRIAALTNALARIR